MDSRRCIRAIRRLKKAIYSNAPGSATAILRCRAEKMALFVDGAWKEGIGNDRSALGLWGSDGVNYYLIDAWADKVEYPDLKTKVKDYWYRWKDKNLAPTFWPCVEDAASGIPIIQEFRRTTNIPIVGVRVDKSKYTRAEAVTPLFEAGKCFLPENARGWTSGLRSTSLSQAPTTIWLTRPLGHLPVSLMCRRSSGARLATQRAGKGACSGVSRREAFAASGLTSAMLQKR